MHILLPQHFSRLVACMIWRAFFFLLISACLVSLALWLLLGHLADHPEWLQARLSRALGQEFRIGRITAAWNGWQPSLRLERGELLEAGQPVAAFASAEIQGEAMASLLAGRLLTECIRLSGLRLRLLYQAGGHIGLDIAGPPGQTESGKQVITWLLAQPHLLLDDLQLTVQSPKGSARFDGVSFSLERDGRLHRFQASARFPEDNPAWPVRGGTLEIRGSSEWQDGTLAKLSGVFKLRQTRAELEAHGLDLPWLDGRLEIEPGRGRLHLLGANLAYRNSALYSAALDLARLQGEFAWHYDAARQGWLIQAETARFHNQDIRQAEASGDLWLPDTGAGEIDLKVAFAGARLNQVAHYVPDRRAGEAAMRWLRQGLAAGTIEQGEFLLRGPLAALPFDHNEGVLQLTGEVSGAQIDYKPGWPALSEVAATVTLRGRGLRIEGRDGLIAGSRLRPTVVEIPDFTSHQPLLTVEGAVYGAADNGLRFIRESPLNRQIQVGQDNLAFGGNALIALSLVIPLHHGPGQRTEGCVTFEGNSLRDRKLNLTLTGLRGDLHFDDRDVRAERLPAKLFGSPVAFSLRRLSSNPSPELIEGDRFEGRAPLPSTSSGSGVESHLTRASLTGRADSGFLRKLALHLDPAFAYLPLIGKLSGAARFQADFDFSAGRENNVKIAIHSDLAGLAVKLPAPLGKPAETRRDFQLAIELPGKSSSPRQLRARHGKMLDAVLEYSARQPLRAGLRFGGEPAVLPVSGIAISGEIKELSLSNWQAALAELPATDNRPTDNTPLRDVVRELDLRIGRFEAGGHGWRDLHVRGNLGADEWRLAADSAELSQGRLVYRPAAHQLEISAARLALPDAGLSRERPAARQQAANWPSLSLLCEDLRHGDLALGRLELQTLAVDGEWLIDHLRLENPDLRLDSQGRWGRPPPPPELVEGEPAERFDKRSDRQADRQFWLHGTLDSPDAGKTLARLGYSGSQLIEGGPTRLTFDARWPGGPLDFSLSALRGWLALEIGKGRILDVEPGVGRVFGLFDLQAVPHRLALDFSDVFAEGLSFERIAGKFLIEDGYATTHGLALESRAALIRLSGRTGLANRTYDQELAVVPHLTNTLPVAGALAGGLGVGVGVLVLQKLLQDELEQGMFYRYRVTGPWDAPQITAVE